MNNRKEKHEFSENKFSIKIDKLVKTTYVLQSLIMMILYTSVNTIDAEFETNLLVFQFKA